MGNVEDVMIAQYTKNKLELPDRIKNKPTLRVGLELYLDAFLELDSERDYTFGPGVLKWSSMYTYAMYLNLDEWQIEKFFYFMRRLDNKRVSMLSKK